MTRLATLSAATRAELSTLLKRERQRKQFSRLGDVDDDDVLLSKQIRWAKTTTNADLTTYPTAPANRFVVEFGDYEFTDTAVGNETPTFTAYVPQISRVALSPVGFLPSGSIVRVSLHHGRWYILPDQYLLYRKGVVTESGGIAADGSGEVTIYLNGSSTSWTVTAHLNWMHGGVAVAQNTKVRIEYYPDEGKWVITNAECA